MSDYRFRSYIPKGQHDRKRSGSALVLLTMVISLVLLPLVGLAIDGSIVFWMKTRLSSSVDAAAVAAARTYGTGTATTIADQYFAADFQPGIMGTTVTSAGGVPVVTAPTPSNGVITVTVSAQVSVPLYFMRMIGQKTASIGASSQATRKIANVILVLDRTYSLAQANACATVSAAAQNFINFFTEGLDTLSLVNFQAGAYVDVAPTQTFKTAINSKLASLVCTGYTTTADGLYTGFQEIKSIANAQNALNVIVLFTDGIPDSVDATFPIKTQADYRYGYSTSLVTAISYNPSSASAPYNTLTSTPASSCSSSLDATGITGILLATLGYGSATGPTWGLFHEGGIAINAQNPYFVIPPGLLPAAITASGCGFAGTPSSTTYNSLGVSADIAYMPQTDVNHNSLLPRTGGKTLDPCPTGTPASSYPYAKNPSIPSWGCWRVDTPTGVANAAWNAVDNMANTIRSDTTYKPIIYTIGLGGTSYQAVDDTLLERIANDPRATNYNSAQSSGTYIYTTAGNLGAAFSQIASQVLRLSQ